MQEALTVLINAQPNFSVCGTAGSAEEALEQLPGSADLVLVDVSLPGMTGLELVRQVRSRWPNLRCLVLSGHSADRYAEPAKQAGAVDYLMKGNAVALIEAIDAIRLGTHPADALSSGGAPV